MCINNKQCKTPIHLQELLFKIKIEPREKVIKQVKRPRIKCTCGLSIIKITQKHLTGKQHNKKNTGLSFKLCINDDGTTKYLLDGNEFTPSIQPEHKEISFTDLVCRICGVTNETGDKFHSTGNDNRCKNCLYKRQKELRDDKKRLGSAYISQKKYY